MKTGILYNILTKRYGSARIHTGHIFDEYQWNHGDESVKSVLYLTKNTFTKRKHKEDVIYQEIYGEFAGGFILGESLKISLREPITMFDLYSLEELSQQPEVQDALRMEPSILFFMDSANVWFYGVKDYLLFVYDSETRELDLLGPIDTAIETLIDEWENA